MSRSDRPKKRIRVSESHVLKEKRKRKKQLAKTEHLRDGKCSLPVNDSYIALFCSSTQCFTQHALIDTCFFP